MQMLAITLSIIPFLAIWQKKNKYQDMFNQFMILLAVIHARKNPKEAIQLSIFMNTLQFIALYID